MPSAPLQRSSESAPAHVERTFRRYLECGILAHGFARACCDQRQHDFLIAYSCKCRGACPSCNTRRMAETAAHLVEHVFPPLPLRQWGIKVPKRLRYFLQRDTALQGTELRIFHCVVERCLREHGSACPATARIGAVAFIHRFGSSLNEHVHFHCCVIDGVFAPPVAPDDAPGVSFHAALELGAAVFADVQARERTRVLRTFVKRGLIDRDDATGMRAWAHDGGFSVDGSCASRAPTGPGSNRVCQLSRGTVRDRLSRWSICTNAMRASGLPQLQAGARNGARRTPGGAGAHAPGADREDRRPGTAAARASPSLLGCARAQCTAALCGNGARPGRRAASADFCGNQRRAPPSSRVALRVGHAAGAHL